MGVLLLNVQLLLHLSFHLSNISVFVCIVEGILLKQYPTVELKK